MADFKKIEFPDALKQCADKFWSDNAELKDLILRDLYRHGRVMTATNELGAIAVDKWLVATSPPPS